MQRLLPGGRGRAWAHVHAVMSRAGILTQSFCVRQALQFPGKEIARTMCTNVRNILSDRLCCLRPH